MYDSPKLWEKVWIKLNDVESALREKGKACVRTFNLFAILFRNAGSLATESSVLFFQRLMETTHFSGRLTWAVSSVTNKRHYFNFYSAFSAHAYTTILVLFRVSFIPFFLFQVSVDAPLLQGGNGHYFFLNEERVLEKKSKIVATKVKCAFKKKIYLLPLWCWFCHSSLEQSRQQLFVLIALQICK